MLLKAANVDLNKFGTVFFVSCNLTNEEQHPRQNIPKEFARHYGKNTMGSPDYLVFATIDDVNDLSKIDKTNYIRTLGTSIIDNPWSLVRLGLGVNYNIYHTGK
jgi:hypothetical protein